ncbi:MAG: ABC transporter ATP-binding protein [Lachnospiraceae bacterium]|nr:ABC transporter ATP-binding protein [Lachnospiraceae bacterium]
MGDFILQVKELGTAYGKHIALENVSFSIQKGEILGVAGENGAGKSTLLSLLATVQKPSHGIICFKGKDIRSGKKAYRSSMGYVPQEIALFEELSGWDNLMFFGKSYHLPEKERKERIREVCRITEFPEEALRRPVSRYSGGMRRKINIGAALLHRPELLLLDEPVANLDPDAEEQVIKALKGLSEQGTAIVYAGHQMDQMEALCDSICFMKDGQQILYGTMEELLHPGGQKIPLKQLWKETSGKVRKKE